MPNVTPCLECNQLSADTGSRSTTIDSPSRQLGAFLRRVRERVQPTARMHTSRRRAVGLRREEVAVAAGISVTWYTWLEQGRPVRVSRETLRAIGAALHLDDIEQRHLEALATVAATAPSSAPSSAAITAEANAALRRLVNALTPHPAYAVNACWDVLHVNDAAIRVFAPFDSRPSVTGNILRRLFLDPAWRTLFVNWDAIASSSVAQFRAATASLASDARVTGLVRQLTQESTVFATLWAQHALAEPPSWDKVLDHPEAGRLVFNYASLTPSCAPPDVRVISYLAVHR